MSTTLARLLSAALVVVALALPSSAAADCYIHYKAKRDTPKYGLHYGIVQSSGSCPSSPERAVRSRISSGGWALLGIVKVTTSPPTATELEFAKQHYYR
ncbi:hypothetical protein KZZ07_10145 [Mameliella sp. CS4]|uniref:hypothetical protein n=1 Tax=Mameliella sp. CS4 TaxID=2862329 RepID=UPI001C607784|nr:hypothetical protein [Mameliella sp. CS4]MBW4982903.1 hypothetical protein [Mameliella sp. CS4]